MRIIEGTIFPSCLTKATIFIATNDHNSNLSSSFADVIRIIAIELKCFLLVD